MPSLIVNKNCINKIKFKYNLLINIVLSLMKAIDYKDH